MIETMDEQITLFDCYSKMQGKAYMTGTQALVRLLLEQAQCDREQGLTSRGLVSGYPGSPLGGLDLELTRHRDRLDAAGIVFQPAVNEELAATALWGAQHIHLYDRPEIDGVFGLWYGKGPGLDRALDALRHANMGGVAPKGGIVLAVGDDPTGKSSTVAYQSEQTMIAAGIPFFYPRSVHDIIPMGLRAFALSRYAGCCVGLKITVDTADASSIVDLDIIRPNITLPEPAGAVHIGRHDPALIREARLFTLRLPAVANFQNANDIDKVQPVKRGKLGIIAVGKASPETQDALRTLGIDLQSDPRIGLLSLTMPWPVNQSALVDFASHYDEVLVIEEKRPIVEEQLAHSIVNIADRAHLSGKSAPDGTALVPRHGELTHSLLVEIVAKRASAHNITVNEIMLPAMEMLPAIPTRTPWYCAGCPHNSSTKLPDGEIVGMGIGCHSISGFLTPDEITNYTQMGGEGAFWIGRAPFSSQSHSFQNIGDGTYAHSGYLGVRAAVAAGVNMTFKILYNGAVAMTGGQAVEGHQPPWMISRQLSAEGVLKIAVVTDDLDAFPTTVHWAKNSQLYHRDRLLDVQQQLRQIAGVTAIIYVQSCATELRRKRKRGMIPDKPETILINQDVCEGCGDCAVKSNCVAVKPLLTPEGEKRQIDQNLCNKDMSCMEGFCPSFVTVSAAKHGRKAKPASLSFPDTVILPSPPAAMRDICNIFIAGIGGTGVSTLSGILVMAARLDGKAATAVNQTGLSQKNGGVTSQVRMATKDRLENHMVRLPTGGADILLGCDSVVAANDLVLPLLNKTHSQALLNDTIDPVGVAGVGIGSTVGQALVSERLGAVMDPARIHRLAISDMANRLMGTTMPSAVIMLGWAAQKGWIPLGIDAIEAALRLNGSAVELNLTALKWGRLLAHDPAQIHSLLAKSTESQTNLPETVIDAIPYFASRLTAYQNAAYATDFEARMTRFIQQIGDAGLDVDRLGLKAAQLLYRAMAIKDEYEVARLLTGERFTRTIIAHAGEDAKITYCLAPPLLGWLKGADGHPRKLRFGHWLTPWLRRLAALSWMRGTWIDPFGFTAERRRERAYRTEVQDWLFRLGAAADTTQRGMIEDALDLMLQIRGYGHIRRARYARIKPQIDTVMTPVTNQPPPIDVAAE